MFRSVQDSRRLRFVLPASWLLVILLTALGLGITGRLEVRVYSRSDSNEDVIQKPAFASLGTPSCTPVGFHNYLSPRVVLR